MNSIKLLEMGLRNFMSFGNNLQIIKLDNPGTTFITGINKDVEQSKNGIGKTTIANGISYIFFDKVLKKNISLNNLINKANNSKNALTEVYIKFLDDNNDLYFIQRTRGASNSIKIEKNNVDITLDSISSNNKFIENLIGISHDLFVRTIIFSGTSTPFLENSLANQREQIEELFKITILSEKAAILKEKISNYKVEVSILENVIKEKENNKKLQEKQLKDIKNSIDSWDKNKINEINKLEQNLSLLKEVDFEHEKTLLENYKKLTTDYKELENIKSSLINDKNKIQKEIQNLEHEVIHLKDNNCPYCKQVFIGSGEKLIEKESKISDFKQILDENTLKTNDILDKIKLLKNDIENKDNLSIFNSINELLQSENLLKNGFEKLSTLKESINPYIHTLESISKYTLDEIKYEELDYKKKYLSHMEFLYKLLMDKNSFIRKNIINKTIPFLNSRISNYTKEFGLPHIVSFNPDMTCTITMFGLELDYGNLSDGQQKRLNLALSFAFRDVHQHLYSKFNIMFFDEIDNSLCSYGINQAFNNIKKKAIEENIQIFIISHRPEAIDKFDRTLFIEYERGFSNIIEIKKK